MCISDEAPNSIDWPRLSTRRMAGNLIEMRGVQVPGIRKEIFQPSRSAFDMSLKTETPPAIQVYGIRLGGDVNGQKESPTRLRSLGGSPQVHPERRGGGANTSASWSSKPEDDTRTDTAECSATNEVVKCSRCGSSRSRELHESGGIELAARVGFGKMSRTKWLVDPRTGLQCDRPNPNQAEEDPWEFWSISAIHTAHIQIRFFLTPGGTRAPTMRITPEAGEGGDGEHPRQLKDAVNAAITRAFPANAYGRGLFTTRPSSPVDDCRTWQQERR